MALMLVTLDVSKLSGWLNFAAPCAEPNGGRVRGAGHRIEQRGASTTRAQESAGRGQGVVQRGLRDASKGASNMRLISVTAEVFQLDMSPLKSARPEKSPLILVTPDTSQVSMGPNVAVVLVESLLNA